jgi:hypothetical protein
MSTHFFVKVEESIQGHLKNPFMTVQEDFAPAVTVHPGRDLQQCAELHFSLIGRDGNRGQPLLSNGSANNDRS